MNGSNQEVVNTWIDEWEALPEAEKARIRSLIKALDKNRIQAQTIEAQDRKIAEQAALLEQRQALLDRHNDALRINAFRLGTQDRELIHLRASNNGLAAALRRAEAQVAELQAELNELRPHTQETETALRIAQGVVAELQAGDVATLRSTVNFQRSEIMRLKAALAERETAAFMPAVIEGAKAIDACTAALAKMGTTLMQGTATAVAEEAEDATDDQRFIWEAERDAYKAKIAELEAALAERETALTERETALTDLRDEDTIKTHYAAGLLDSVKALQLDIERLKGIADHSNNLAQNRLEELAKLRRELAVARDAAAKLEARLQP